MFMWCQSLKEQWFQLYPIGASHLLLFLSKLKIKLTTQSPTKIDTINKSIWVSMERQDRVSFMVKYRSKLLSLLSCSQINSLEKVLSWRRPFLIAMTKRYSEQFWCKATSMKTGLILHRKKLILSLVSTLVLQFW